MNEKKIINKLKLLKSVQPDQTVLKEIKRGVYLNVGKDKNKKKQFAMEGKELFTNFSLLLKSYRFISVGVIFAFVLLFMSFVVSVFLPDQLHNLTLYSKVALAPNQYEKANLALNDVMYNYGKQKPLGENNINNMSQELAFTNTEMSILKLKGEKGKYTAQQCHELYQQYLIYLKEENANIPASNQQLFSLIKSKINTYEEQAELKLHLYPHL